MYKTLVSLVACLLLISCGSSRNLSKADSNAGSNAAAAGVGVLVYGLITDDKKAVRKAGATAAAAAATTKVKESSNTRKQEAEWERTIGPDNSAAAVALIKRDYRSVKTHLQAAKASEQVEYQRAARWLTALWHYDTGNDAELEPQLSEIVKTDAAIADDSEARNGLKRLNGKLTSLRKQYK